MCDGQGRPLVMLLTEGQTSDYKGPALMLDALPPATAMLGDRSSDADWFRAALIAKGIAPCIPSTRNQKLPIPHDPVLYRPRHRIENMFGKLKDWRSIHTRYDRFAHTFFSAITIAATAVFKLDQSVLSLGQAASRAREEYPRWTLHPLAMSAFIPRWAGQMPDRIATLISPYCARPPRRISTAYWPSQSPVAAA